MKIAVINEISACDKNADIMEALAGRGHEVLNAGMKTPGDLPALSYLHTGFLAGLLLNAGAADFVVGGCGTGIGFVMSAMMYPNVYCGLIAEPLDAWLFNRINAGNCISLMLNKGWGWGGGINLGFIFDRLFSDGWGTGYPEHRKQAQLESRLKLEKISIAAHKPMEEIIAAMDPVIVRESLSFPGIGELLGPYCEKLKIVI
ncbi:MAG: RpiB/LacA/LacB family sugar-phosphate isomerase [Oscillospiraceae bacterium]|nr:RpiB/LacA/LacB family sugar-phosphate isomerase [Oscillospiraceae bacterium]